MIESTKNSRTVVTREVLEDLTREFESVCSTGEIIYLGTPQSTESIYNNLPGRGYAIRIWTGRYLTFEQESNYSDMLAPMLTQDMLLNPSIRSGCGLDGMQGQPTCPEMFDEDTLLTKELSMGSSKFQLQFMLNTKLADEERYPLKLRNFIVQDYSMDSGPVLPIWTTQPGNLYQSASCNGKYKLYRGLAHEYEVRPFEQRVMYIDPAGGGSTGDEMAYACIGLIGAYVYVLKVGGVPGGFEEESLLKLVRIARETKCRTVLIEKNFGNGAHANMIKPLFTREEWPVTIEEVWETGQKELRIIDTLEPLLSSHRLIISPTVIEDDFNSIQRYAPEVRGTYRLLHQMSLITRDRGCLRHDDRLDALASAVRHVVERLDFDTKTLIEARRRREQIQGIEAWKDPVSRRKWMVNVCTESLRSTTARNRFGSRQKRRF